MYTAQGAPDKEDLVRQHAQLVKRLAFQLMAKLPASVQADDLIQNGMIGLLDALNRFQEGMGAQFETYAAQRIRGAMLDGLRDNDWVPRGVRRDARRGGFRARVARRRSPRPARRREAPRARRSGCICACPMPRSGWSPSGPRPACSI